MKIVNTTPTGTMIPTEPELSEGTKMKSASIRSTGATAIFQFFEMSATPRAPKSAGSIWSKAGVRTGFERIGLSGTMRITPSAIITVVTKEETAIAMVDIIGIMATNSNAPIAAVKVC